MRILALQQYVESNIISRYADFDEAHNQDHVRAVIDESLNLCQYYNVDENMAYTIAAYHDVGMPLGRSEHHIHSARILIDDPQLKLWFLPQQILVMAQAVEDHRASAEHIPRSIYGCIVADADRNLDITKVILRTMQYGKNYYPDIHKKQLYERTLAHLQEKYAEGGYLKLWLNKGKAYQQLQALRLVIANEQQLQQYFDKLYTQIVG